MKDRVKVEVVPEMSAAYEQYRPLFLHALGKLARQGFSTPISDALDLIHDFFAEGWSRLLSTYDPTKGPFAAYLYSAFVHFSRPRIIRSQRLSRLLVDIDECRNLRVDSGESGILSDIDRQVVLKSISKLPTIERTVLESYLYSSEGSERTLAKALSLSRYSVRNILVRALGKVITSLDRPRNMNELDWMIALGLWRDNRSVAEISDIYGLTVWQVRKGVARNLEMISRSLINPQRRIKGEKPMPNSEEALSALALMRTVLSSPGNKDLLGKLSKRTREVLQAIEENDAELRDIGRACLDTNWVAQVFETLAQGAGVSFDPIIEEPEVVKTLFEANREDEASVGTAFKETLLPALPITLLDVRTWIGPSELDPEELKYMAESPDVQAALPESSGFVSVGITPLTIYYATEAVSSLLSRLRSRGSLRDDGIVLPQKDSSFNIEDEGQTFRLFDLLVDDISRMAECGPEKAEGLYAWLVQVAGYKPYLFNGYEATLKDYGLVLRPATEHLDNLFERWGRAHQTALVYA